MRKSDFFVLAILLCYVIGILGFPLIFFAPSLFSSFSSSGKVFVTFMPFLFLLIGSLCAFALWIWMIVDLIKRPLNNKVLWALLLVLVGILAALIYYAMVYRKDLRETGSNGQQSGTSNALTAILVIFIAGFVLIVMAIVVGVLVFIVSSPSDLMEGVTCFSNDPARIMVKVSNITANAYSSLDPNAELATLGTIKVVNASGGDITNVSCVGSGAFAGQILGCEDKFEIGAEINLMPVPSNKGTFDISRIEFKYTDMFDATKTAIISCSGPITIS